MEEYGTFFLIFPCDFIYRKRAYEVAYFVYADGSAVLPELYDAAPFTAAIKSAFKSAKTKVKYTFSQLTRTTAFRSVAQFNMLLTTEVFKEDKVKMSAAILKVLKTTRPGM